MTDLGLKRVCPELDANWRSRKWMYLSFLITIFLGRKGSKGYLIGQNMKSNRFILP